MPTPFSRSATSRASPPVRLIAYSWVFLPFCLPLERKSNFSPSGLHLGLLSDPGPCVNWFNSPESVSASHIPRLYLLPL